VPAAQFLVEVLHGEIGILLAIQPAHPRKLALRRATARYPAQAPVPQTLGARLRVARPQSPEMSRRHPEQLPALLEANPSYVFFREVAPPVPGTLEARIDGPIGSLGVPLLAERTIAVDPRYVPLGAPVFIDTTRPLSNAPLQRLVLAQDTGGAIRGIARADFFWGFGDSAAREAGRMRQQGRMWLLWPRRRAAGRALRR